jgi:3',5'-nucleoside bisphosphate phosphatase
MIAEMHCHSSEHSACSHVCAVDLIRKAAQLGLQGLVLTDHHYFWPDEELLTTRNRAGIPDDFILLSGQEISTSDFGDVLLFGPKQTVEKQELKLSELRNRFPEAAIVWAHPYRYKSDPSPERLLSGLIDAVEVINNNHTILRNVHALEDWHDLKFTATAGTDTHSDEYTGSFPTVFDHPFGTLEELAAEIRAGRCRPLLKEIPRSGTSRTQVKELIIGLKRARRHSAVIVKKFDGAETWTGGDRSFRLAQEFMKHGFLNGLYRIPQPLACDPRKFTTIEELIRGRTLHDILIEEKAEKAHHYLCLAARWLAHLHNLNLHVTPVEEHSHSEPSRLLWYLRHIFFQKHPQRNRVGQIREQVWDIEKRLMAKFPERLVQSHGDFHLKNIYVSEDRDTGLEFTCAIDLNSSYQLPRAFDVGTFVAQHLNMFESRPDVAAKAPAELFIVEYMKHACNLEDDFGAQVALFRARASLSILYYLSKVGKQHTANFHYILGEAEKSLIEARFIELE